jgi:hypothetical protein
MPERGRPVGQPGKRSALGGLAAIYGGLAAIKSAGHDIGNRWPLGAPRGPGMLRYGMASPDA